MLFKMALITWIAWDAGHEGYDIGNGWGRRFSRLVEVIIGAGNWRQLNYRQTDRGISLGRLRNLRAQSRRDSIETAIREGIVKAV